MLLSLLNLPFSLGCQHCANPVGQGAVVHPCGFLPEGSFLFVESQRVVLACVFLCHAIDDNWTSLVLTLDVQWRYVPRPARMAFIAGCPTSEIPGSPDFTRPSICDYLERVFSWGAE